MAIDDAQLARPYAEAAHKHAQAAGGASLADWSKLLDNLATSLTDPALQALLADPRVTPDQTQQVIDGLLDKQGVNDDGMRAFVAQLREHDRLGVGAEIARQYAELRRNAEGILEAEIRTAFELDKGRIDAIAAKLKERFGSTKVNTNVILDESLDGGVVIIAGDDVIDCSVNAELNQMRNALSRP